MLDALHLRARAWVPFQRLAILSRILLALAFIPTGMVKVLGQRFTVMGTDTTVGYFFEAMYQSGFYWNFIGLGQVVAGILLLIPATATLGAVAFFPIVLNITVVTWSVGFVGTTYITTLMLLASVFLLCWDWDRLRNILVAPAPRTLPTPAPLAPLERAGYLIGTTAGMAVMLMTRSLFPGEWLAVFIGVGAVAGLMVAVGWVQVMKRERWTANGER
jgi:uncharacterized membrane protein YphA (DoxX/SURF4 family)